MGVPPRREQHRCLTLSAMLPARMSLSLCICTTPICTSSTPGHLSARSSSRPWSCARRLAAPEARRARSALLLEHTRGRVGRCIGIEGGPLALAERGRACTASRACARARAAPAEGGARQTPRGQTGVQTKGPSEEREGNEYTGSRLERREGVRVLRVGAACRRLESAAQARALLSALSFSRPVRRWPARHRH